MIDGVRSLGSGNIVVEADIIVGGARPYCGWSQALLCYPHTILGVCSS